MKRKTKNRLILLAVLAGIALVVFLGYRFVVTNLLISTDQVIRCGQKSVWNDAINAAELEFTEENEYCAEIEMDGGLVKGYRLPVGEYGLISFGTANIYVYEALTFDGVTDYYQTWIVNFYSGSEVIQRTTYTAPDEFTSVYVEDYIEITEADNLVVVNGTAEFYIDPEALQAG